jgi:adenosylcobinamide-phosphate synthase
LERGDLPAARELLTHLCARDPSGLRTAELARASVESLAENTSDAVVAPLFWAALAGAPGVLAYRAVNTLDAMVGYRSERYRDFGWASARLDDLAALIPARLTWLLIALAALLLGERSGTALRIGWRDGRKHPSPNAAWGEAAMAGALGVRLGGPATYGGVPSVKPFLGDPGDPIDPAAVRRAVGVLRTAAVLAIVLAWAARAWLLRVA